MTTRRYYQWAMLRPGQPSRTPALRRPAILARACACASVLLVAGVATTPAQVPRARLDSCPIFGLPGPAQCGSVTVFEDRAAGSGRTIAVRIVVLPASGPGRGRADPLVILVGGPGDVATTAAPALGAAFALIRRSRDLVLVDQRGTGQSSPLWCAPPEDPRRFFGAVFPREVIRACRAHAESLARPELYTTPAAADDLDDVRAALGYATVNLYGVSYGTRLALIYLRRHPARVRSIVLDGAAPSELEAPLWYARDAEQAMTLLMEDCASDGPCKRAFPALPHDFALAVARLDTGTTTTVVGNDDSTPVTVRFDRGDFGYAVRGMLYASDLSRLPALIHRAAIAHDYRPFAQAYLNRARTLWARLSFGLHLSVLCTEDVRRIAAPQVEPAARGTFLGDYVIREYQAACEGWPVGTVPPGYYAPIHSAVPALILSGRRDPVTPPRWGERVARNLANSRHLVFRFGGHASVSDAGCKQRIIEQFVREGSAAHLDVTCATEMRAAPSFFVAPAKSRYPYW